MVNFDQCNCLNTNLILASASSQGLISALASSLTVKWVLQLWPVTTKHSKSNASRNCFEIYMTHITRKSNAKRLYKKKRTAEFERVICWTFHPQFFFFRMVIGKLVGKPIKKPPRDKQTNWTSKICAAVVQGYFLSGTTMAAVLWIRSMRKTLGRSGSWNKHKNRPCLWTKMNF